MAEVWVMGEMLVEIMRAKEDIELFTPDTFVGPFPSGAPAIFIDTVARLGHKAGIIGGVGKDDFGKCLLDRLNKDGVNTSRVFEDANGTTGVAFVTYFSDGSRKFIFHLSETPATSVVAPREEVFAGCKYFHIMGCSLTAKKEFGQQIVKAMHRAKLNGAKVSFDPNIRKELLTDSSCFELINEVIKNTNVFLPGLEELLLIAGEKNVQSAVDGLFKNPEMEIVALKNGSKGSNIYTRNESVSVGVYPVEAVDATGAGDSYDAAFICGLIEGKSVLESGQMAAAAGALNTAAFGPMEGRISQVTVRQMINGKK